MHIEEDCKAGLGVQPIRLGMTRWVMPKATAGLAFNGTMAEARLQIGACQGMIGHGAGSVG